MLLKLVLENYTNRRVIPIYDSIQRSNFAKYLFLQEQNYFVSGMKYVSPETYLLFLQNLEKALLKNLICSYGISFSWKILCVL